MRDGAVITITRQLGAGGSAIARVLAERLGLEVVDRQVVASLARVLGITDAAAARHDEKVATALTRAFSALAAASADLGSPDRPFVTAGQRVIWEAAARGGVVIVGRGAACLLRRHPRALHVFLHAEEPVRAARLVERLGISEKEACRRLRQVDAERAAFVRHVYRVAWNDPAHYHLVVDTGRLGHEAAAEAIVAAAGRLAPHPAGVE